MNWLISLLMASAMFSSEGNLTTAKTNYNFADSHAKNIVKADETERFERTYALDANGRVSVSNINGSIAVETWDRNEVKLEYVKTADSREHLAEVDINIEARQDSFSVETNYGSRDERKRRNFGNAGKMQIEYHLTIPRSAVLDEIETVNGSVTISNASNTTKASAVNGDVRATNLRGAANLSTVNGTVTAEFDTLGAAGKISLNTVNGQANLVIPSDAGATVKAETLNGKIENDFGLPVRKGEYVGKDLYGKIGSGAVQIRLSSVNGGLSIKRKNDGKTLSPATNLLPQKSKSGDDFDNDFDEDEDGDDAAANKRNTKGKVKIKRKEISEALKDAEKQIAEMQPEIGKITAEALKQAAAEINTEELRKQIKEAQKTALAQMSEANWFGGAPKIEVKSDTFAVKGTPFVKINARNCAVAVRGWDKSEVKYAITKISRSQNQSPVAVKADHTDSEVNIEVSEASRGDFMNDENFARVEVYVPKKSNLKISTDREIRLEDVFGELEIRGEGEAINVRDSGGTLRVASADGMIRIVGFRGEIDSKTVDGMMNLDGDFQKLSARTVDGTIVLTLPENANVNIESNRKDIKSEGIPLVFQGDGKSAFTWKIGKGGENFLLYITADGKVFIRSASAINAVE